MHASDIRAARGRGRPAALILGSLLIAAGVVTVPHTYAEPRGFRDDSHLNLAFSAAPPREVTLAGVVDGVHGTVPTGKVGATCLGVDYGTQDLSAGAYEFRIPYLREWGRGTLSCVIEYFGDHNHLPSRIDNDVDLGAP